MTMKPLRSKYGYKKYKYFYVSKNVILHLMNMRELHILLNSAKTWHVIVCWFLCFSPNLPELIIKFFCFDVQNNFMISSGKFRRKHRNQQTITCQVLAELNKIRSCLIFIKLYRCNKWTELYLLYYYSLTIWLICWMKCSKHLQTHNLYSFDFSG